MITLICGILKKNQTYRYREQVVAWGQRWGCEVGEMGEESQKVQTSSYKTYCWEVSYTMVAIVKSTVLYV